MPRNERSERKPRVGKKTQLAETPSPAPSLDTGDSSLMVLDRELRIRMVNRTTLRLLGYEESELIGKPVASIMGHPRESVSVLSSLSDLLLTDNRESIGLTYYDRNHAPVPVTFSSYSLTDGHRLSGVVCVAGQREPGVEGALRADRTDSDRHLTLLSHELRTPLNGILGMAELLLDTNLAEDQRDYAESIMESGRTLFSAVRQLLDYGQAESCPTTSGQVGFDLQECLDEAVHHVQPLVRGKLLNLGLRVDKDVPRSLRGDPLRLRQILMHLLTNAARFTEQGEILVRVQTDHPCEQPGMIRLRFSVEDTGVGIPRDKLGVIFEPFRQADEGLTRRHGGLGLGLSITRRLVELMHGTIWAQSSEGNGSTFTFTALFPKSDHLLTDAALASGLDGGPLRTPNRATRRLRVLLAEGDTSSRKSARRLLRTWGHEVTSVDDGFSAVDTWKHGEFDLILLDLEMPKLDGLHAALSIRKEEGRSAHVPLIGMTGNDTHREEQNSLLAGMDGCVSKPLDPASLMQAIENVLRDTPRLRG